MLEDDDESAGKKKGYRKKHELEELVILRAAERAIQAKKTNPKNKDGKCRLPYRCMKNEFKRLKADTITLTSLVSPLPKLKTR